MLKTESLPGKTVLRNKSESGLIAVIWIDWYAYHIARFRGLLRNAKLRSRVLGIELVGGVGVHAGLKFRESRSEDLPIETLFPDASWSEKRGLQSALALWRKLSQVDPQMVLVPGYYTFAGFAAAAWGKLHGRRTVLMTESTEADHQRTFWKEWAKGQVLRLLFDWAVAGGTPHCRYLERLGFARERTAQFYDVVDNAFFAERADAIRKHSAPSDFDLPEHYFLYVGRLSEEKNLHCLLDAYGEYRQGGGNWALVVVGDGAERKSLEAKAAASSWGADVHFPGLKTTSELPQYYAFASCFVLPSSREPWGLVVNEAMASGLPVIVSESCGCGEDLVVPSENGFLFDPASRRELTSSLRTLENLSIEDRERMGRRSAEIIARFSPEAWAQEIARIASA